MQSAAGGTPVGDWHSVAEAWEEFHEYIEASVRPVTRRMLEMARLRTGETVLEVGGGVGTLGLRLAELVGSSGKAVLTDAAPGMVEAAQRRVSSLGVTNVEVSVQNGEALDLPDARFDAVVCRMGYMLIPSPDRAFAEARRVLRDGGRLSFSVWAGPEHNVWALLLGMGLMQSGISGGPDPFGPGGLFSLADRDRLETLLREAGFQDVQMEEVDSPHSFTDATAYWDTISKLAGPLAVILERTPKPLVDEVKANVISAAKQYQTPQGVELPGRALVVRAS